jgi:hypothetical protein
MANTRYLAAQLHELWRWAAAGCVCAGNRPTSDIHYADFDAQEQSLARGSWASDDLEVCGPCLDACRWRSA